MKPIKTLKVSIAGIRGVVGDSLQPLLLYRFARSFGAYLGGSSIVVGRDTRPSGEMVKHAVFAGLLSSRARVLDVDICPVPTIQHAVRTLKCQGGIAITASHNPIQWNALKFIKGNGRFLSSYEAEELLSLYHQQDFQEAGPNQIKTLEPYGHAVRDHLEHILKTIRPRLEPSLKVVVDCCNGAGSVMTPRLLTELGCDVVEISCDPHNIFPRNPEPLPENLGELCRAVKEHDADVGFAQDADADRLAIVSNEGVAIGEDYTLALCVLRTLEHEKGPVVANLSTSRIIEDVAQAAGCPVFRSRIGEVNVTELMDQSSAVIGGEGNGGVIYPKVNFARDSFVAMSLVIDLLRSRRQKLSEIIADFPTYSLEKSVFEIHPHRITTMIDELIQVYESEHINTLDGLKIDRPEGWIHIRPSNTEPILRLVIEARDHESLDRFREEMKERIAELSAEK